MSGVREEVVVPDPVYRQDFTPRRHNKSHLGGRVGLAALSALTGGVLTWAAMAHGGLGTPTATPGAVEPAGTFHDGTFTGAGFAASGGDIVVTVTVANGQITDVTATYPDEADMSGDINRAHIPELIDATKAAQSGDIANITGATVSSTAFRNSLQDALNQARGAGGGGAAAVEPAHPIATAPAAPVGNLHDGVFFGQGFESGPGGNTYVAMTVLDGRIAGISATYPIGNETSTGLSAGAIPTLVTEAKEAQSADIDIVSGATHTSDAFKQSLQDAINQASHGAPVVEPLGTVADGTFTGNPASTGRAGDTRATIHVSGGRITEVTYEAPDHEWGDHSNATVIPQLVDQIVTAQSPHVNIVTGATGTSTAFLTSVQSAINQARGGDTAVAPPAAAALHDGTFFGDGFESGPGGNTYVTMHVVDGNIVGVSATYPIGNEESRGISAGAIPTLVTEAKDAQSADIDVVAGATNTSNAFKQSLQHAINASKAGAPTVQAEDHLTDGTFVGNPASTGRAGDTVATIVVSGGRITDITYEAPDHEWGDHSNATVIPQIIEDAKQHQTANVSNVTGATGSSTAFKASLQSAINQARG